MTDASHESAGSRTLADFDSRCAQGVPRHAEDSPRHADAMRRRVLLSAAAIPASLGLAACGGPALGLSAPRPSSQPLPPAAVKPGDRWRYVLINRFNRSKIGEATHEVVEASPQLRLRLTDSRFPDAREERYADPWTVLLEQTFDMPLEFQQPVPLVPPGFGLGAVQATSTRYTASGASGGFVWQQQLSASRSQRIEVPAGAFECIRIERNIWFTHTDFFRSRSNRLDTLWYAPEVNRWVQREWTGEYLMGNEAALGPRPVTAREDWIQWQLLAYDPSGR